MYSNFFLNFEDIFLTFGCAILAETLHCNFKRKAPKKSTIEEKASTMDYQLPDPCITISGKVPKIGKFPEEVHGEAAPSTQHGTTAGPLFTTRNLKPDCEISIPG